MTDEIFKVESRHQFDEYLVKNFLDNFDQLVQIKRHSQKSMITYLKEDFRIDLDFELDSQLIEKIAEVYKSKNLRTLAQVITLSIKKLILMLKCYLFLMRSLT